MGSRSAFIVPATAGNRAHRDPSEGREAPGAENRCRDTREGTLSPANLSTNRQRIANLARSRPGVALNSIHHVIDLAWMKEAYRLTRKDGAPGIDGVTAADYEANLEANLSDLLDRIRSGRYHAPPVRRAYIPKADGTQRPLGIPTFEDKVAQRAVAMVLEAIYEQDFLPCSYGFRPGRSAHQALDALRAACMGCGMRWCIDVDIKSYFDTIDRGHLRDFLDQRVTDGVIRRMIDKWLKAGVLEEGRLHRPTQGSPQGGVISPCLSNIYLHHVLDVWFEYTVRPRLKGRASLVRYADDRAPRRREEVRDVTSNSWQPCCTRDEGRPLGLGLQDRGPNHRKLRRSNGRGGERCGKRRDQSRQVCAGQTNASEPLLTCRKRRDVAKTRLQVLAWDEARRKPADWPSGDRHEDGVRPARGSCAERGNLSPRCQGRPPRGRPLRSRVPMRGEGTDGFVVPSRPGNAGGGKGPDTPAEEAGQPAMGGAGV